MPENAETEQLHVLIEFDGPLAQAQADEFVAILAAELEYRDLQNERYQKSGWGMGHTRVIRVTREKERA